tara:strand:- start:217 stop:570 length:354 start_codon:yes stop_codon:yes gene_type:complete
VHINGTPQTLVEEKKQEDDKKYITEEEEQERIRVKEEELYDELSEDDYDQFLNDCYEGCSICGNSYTPSEILYAIDRGMYDTGFTEWKDGEMERLNEQACEMVAEELEEEGKEVKYE